MKTPSQFAPHNYLHNNLPTKLDPITNSSPPKPREFAVSHWTNDPNIQGGWSVLKPGATPSTTRQYLANTPFCHNRVILAGEYTSSTDSGMVHGAYLEGVRAANQIIQQQQQKQQQHDDGDDGKHHGDHPLDVIIIGAGAAGLGCAHTLQNSLSFTGNVKVMEAKDRIGGRVHTVSFSRQSPIINNNSSSTASSSPFIHMELGANWMQQVHQGNPLHHLATKNSTTTQSSSPSSTIIVHPTDFLQPLEFPKHASVRPERVEAIMNELTRRCRYQGPGRYTRDSILNTTTNGSAVQHPIISEMDNEENGYDAVDIPSEPSLQTIVEDWIHELNHNNNTTQQEQNFTVDEILHVIQGEVSIDCGVPLSELSSKYGMEPGVGEGDYWVVGGYKQILDILAHNINISLSTTIKSVIWNPTKEKLELQYFNNSKDNDESNTSPCTIDADYVICTIPASILGGHCKNINNDDKDMQTSNIIFHPPLPPKHLQALQLITTGRVEKVILLYDQRWWPSNDNGYIRANGYRVGDVSEWLDCTDVYGIPVISGIFVGDWMEEIWYHDENNDGDGRKIPREDYEIACLAGEALFNSIHGLL